MTSGEPMHVSWDGRTYQFPTWIDNETANQIIADTGMDLPSWHKAIGEGDPIALRALLWVMKRQSGEDVPIGSLNFSVYDFHSAVFQGALAAQMQRVGPHVR